MTTKSKKKQAAKQKAKAGGAGSNGFPPQKSHPHPSKPSFPKTKLSTSTAVDVEEDDDDELAPEDIQTAVDVLEILSAEPEVLQKKEYKALKRAGWEFGRVLSSLGAGTGASTQSQISHLLSLSLYREALTLLFDLYVSKAPTKLGALQRWVRECDATARPGEVLTASEKEERRTVLRCLDLVLRVCGGVESGKAKGKMRRMEVEWEENDQGEDAEEQEEHYGEGVVKRMKVWNARRQVQGEAGISGKVHEELPMWDLIQKGFLETDLPKSKVDGFYPVQTTPGHLRRPPNVYASTVHASTVPSPVPYPTSQSHPAFSLPHPCIPTCKIILNVLPPTTCQSIISSANALGWEPDQAAGGSAVEKTSVLAHNVVWLADEEFVGKLFETIRPFVPERAGGSGEKGDGMGGKVRGINRRFRVYRYGPKQVYRPHIDGAWPAAGIDLKAGEYLHDSSPSDDPLWSRYTLLIYLNSDINGSPPSPTVPAIPGATTFFLPSPTSIGTMLSFPIAPLQGAVLVFPHGDARASLLHEGSPVGDGGWKVVIRTDLLYEAEGFGEFAPGKKRKLAAEGEDAGGDGEEAARGVSKIAKVVVEGKAEGEVTIPKALGNQSGGDGLEGAGG